MSGSAGSSDGTDGEIENASPITGVVNTMLKSSVVT